MADNKVQALLDQWQMPELIEKFEEHGITYEILCSLPYLNDNEILAKLIPVLGQQIKLRSLLKTHLADNSTASCSTSSCSTSSSMFLFPSPSTSSSQQCFLSSSDLSDSIDLNNIPIVINSISAEPDTVPIVGCKRKRTKVSDFNLEDILNLSSIGRAIIAIYKANQLLDIRSQNYLVEIISLHFLNDSSYGRLNNQDVEELADKIVTLFPREKKEIYYIPPIKKRNSKENKSGIARGKLIDKYRNKLTYLRTAGVWKTKIDHSDSESEKETETEDTRDSAENDSIIWLKHNNHTANWSEVYMHWEKTYTIRLNDHKNCSLTLNEIFNKWEILKNPLGYTLIEKDFISMFSKEQNLCLFAKFDEYFEKILALRKKCIISAADNFMLNLLDTPSLPQNSQYLIKICLLCTLIPPKGRTRQGKHYWKPTTVECREGLLVEVKIAGDIEKSIADRHNKMKNLGLTVQPFIIRQHWTSKVFI